MVRSPLGRLIGFLIVATVLLGAATVLGLVHPAPAEPDLRRYLPAITAFTVVSAGLIDGVNPCAFTVLLLLIAALLASTQVGGTGSPTSVRTRVTLLGSTYIGAIFLTYLALGVGVLGAGRFLSESHLPSRLGAFAAVLVGLWMLKDVFLPDMGWRLEAPHGLTARANSIARRGSIPALVIGGVLVGLCTVPCSGAVYLAVLSFLAAEESPLRAYGYLLLYDLLFVTPLLAIVVVASSRTSLAYLARWQERYRNRVRFVLGSSVIGLGLLLLIMI